MRDGHRPTNTICFIRTITGARPELAKQVQEVLSEARRDSKVHCHQYLMTPRAEGEGVHNETRRGSLGNEGFLKCIRAFINHRLKEFMPECKEVKGSESYLKYQITTVGKTYAIFSKFRPEHRKYIKVASSKQAGEFFFFGSVFEALLFCLKVNCRL